MSLLARVLIAALMSAALVVPTTLHATPAPHAGGGAAAGNAAVAAHSPAVGPFDSLLRLARQVWESLRPGGAATPGRGIALDPGPSLDPNG